MVKKNRKKLNSNKSRQFSKRNREQKIQIDKASFIRFVSSCGGKVTDKQIKLFFKIYNIQSENESIFMNLANEKGFLTEKKPKKTTSTTEDSKPNKQPINLNELTIQKKKSERIVLSYDSLIEQVSFFNQYHLDNEYIPYLKGKQLSKIDFSVRLNHVLNANNIITAYDLLSLSKAELSSFKNCGKGSISEAVDYMNRLIQEMLEEIDLDDLKNTYFHDSSLRDEYKSILDGILSGEETLSLDKSAYETISLGIEMIGIENVSLLNDYDYLTKLRSYTNHLYDVLNIDIDELDQVDTVYNKIPKEYKSMLARGFTYVFDDQLLNEPFFDQWLNNHDDATIRDLYFFVRYMPAEVLSTVKTLFELCCFNLEEDIKNVINMLKTHITNTQLDILESRAKGETLDSIGKRYGTSRERIRQIEKKIVSFGMDLFEKNRILEKIYALRNCDEVLTYEELEVYFQDNVNLAIYVLKNGSNFDFIKQINSFVLKEGILYKRAKLFVNSLPEYFPDNDLPIYLKQGEEAGLSSEIIKLLVQNEYRYDKHYYYKSRFTLRNQYAIILDKYFPYGINVYDHNELDCFREAYEKEFNQELITKNDRALCAAITDITILIDRGKYQLRNDQNSRLSEDLKEKIQKLINQSNGNSIGVEFMFETFRPQLEDEGVSNQYHFYTLLKETFGNQYNYRRAYLIKEGSELSVISNIVDYIKGSKLPLSKLNLQRQFLGVKSVTLSSALSNPKIINLFGRYIHVDQLQLSEKEIENLFHLIEHHIQDNNYVSVKLLYSILNETDSALLKRNFIYNAYSLFSVLNYYFGDDYQFQRPYISRKGYKIESAEDVFYQLLEGKEVLEIEMLSEYFRNHQLAYMTRIDMINSLNNKYLMINHNQIATYDYIGIDEEKCSIVCKLIEDEVKTSLLIRSLSCLHCFPKLNIRWNEWLVYSIINKYSDTLEVRLSNSMLEKAIPIVGVKNHIETDLGDQDGRLNMYFDIDDDSDDIDSIMDELMEDDLDFDFEDFDFE